MSSQAPARPRWASTRASFDPVYELLSRSRHSVAEAEVLRESHWSLGEDARLREDVRFKQTRWGRRVAATAFVANDALYRELLEGRAFTVRAEEFLSDLDRAVDRHCMICGADPRLVVDGEQVRLSARELSDEPLVESDVAPLERYGTHLPLHSLKAAAASTPAGEWGTRAQENVIDTLGWVRVSLPGRSLNSRMFVAKVEGHSMDDGRSGLVDGRYAVFELWPAGTRQGLVVLVRGSFTDPETGSYAVKKYVSDSRNADGRHQRITLASLNPDKTRFPDIALDVTREDDLTVVARLVQGLSVSELTRRPRAPRRPGRRDLTATADLFADAESYRSRFFASPSSLPESDSRAIPAEWRSELVCLDAAGGGLHLQVGPLAGLWSFVKQLRLTAGDWHTLVLASNLRVRTIRVQTPPSVSSWAWTAVGFEVDSDVDLTTLGLPALDVQVVHVFKVDASGVGRRVSGPSLARGQRYRLLFATSLLASIDAPPQDITTLPCGWHLWDLEVPTGDPGSILPALRSLGLELGDADARVEWVLVPPCLWSTTQKGDSYASFLEGTSPVLSVSGPLVDEADSARLFVAGPAGRQSVALQRGTRTFVRLDGLSRGQYSALALFDRTRVPPAYAAFEILPDLPPLASARCELRLGEQVLPFASDVPTRLRPMDLGTVVSDGQEGALQVSAPPGWPVRISWREESEALLTTLHAGMDGILEGRAVLSACYERVRRRLLGDLVLDAAELGRLILPHERQRDGETIRTAVRELVSARGEIVRRGAGDYELLLARWFEPVCELLGYELEPMDLDAANVPGHFRVCRLYRVERFGARIERSVQRLLVLARTLSDFSADVRGWIDQLCSTSHIREALLSDGIQWALHRRTSRLPLVPRDVEEASADEEMFVEFLRDAAEGV